MHVHGSFGANVDYTLRVTIQLADAVDPALLRDALEKTQRRYPYLSVCLKKDESAYYYEENPLPVVLLHEDGRIALNTERTNHHVWAVCCFEDRIHLDFYHGITDGTGVYRVLATLLYYYCAARYGVTDHRGICTLDDPIRPEEIADPQDFLVPSDSAQLPGPPPSNAFTLETDGGLTPFRPSLWDVEVPEDAFMRFTVAHDATPGTMISLLLARAIDTLYPTREKEIVSAYVINARHMLDAELTHHNCLSIGLLPYSDRIRTLPLTRQCTVSRGKIFLQTDADRIRETMSAVAGHIRTTAKNAPTLTEKKQLFGQMFNAGEGVISFLVSYTGKWRHPALGEHIRAFWSHPPNTFSLMVEIGAVNGRIFLTIQQRFREDTVRNAFLRQLEEHQIPYTLRRVMESDVAAFPEP